MLMKNIQALKVKIVILLSALIVFITIVMTALYIQNLNTLVDSNIELVSKTLLLNEKKELKNKIDLASNILTMYYHQTEPKYIENVVKQTLISHQEQLFSQLTNFYKENKDKYTKKELQDRLKFLVKHARYGSNGYFWINDMKCKMIMHPIKPEYNNKYFIHTQKVPFVELGVKRLHKLQKDQVFIKYRFYNPATKKYEFKVSIVKIFKPYNWIIGTGQYLSDITPIIKKRALNDIEALRYGDNGYFWINNTHYKMIMHPIKEEYDGKFFINDKKVPFVKLGVDALRNNQKESAIIEYVFYNPATGKYEKKLSIVKLFKPWNWIIGTGVYLNKIDESIAKVTKIKDNEEKNFIYKIIIFAIVLILTTIFISYYLIVTFIIKPVQNLNNEKKHFEEISQIDFLTNTLNRRAFFDEANKYFAYAYRNNLTITIMMIDIDYFKKINDTFSHEAGDQVIKHISQLINESIREEDTFGRLGGEEFGLCILNANKDTTFKIAEKIRERIENSSVLYNGKRIHFTISIGVYIVQSYSENPNDALNKADKALYKAKESGRNRVAIYNELLK